MKRVRMVTSIMCLGFVCGACGVDPTAPGGGEGENVGSTGEALTASSTPFAVAGWHGGSGGDVYTEVYCDPGYVVVGFYGYSGATMDSLGLHCALFYKGSNTWQYTYNRPPQGGTGGNLFSGWCPPGSWVAQVLYEYNSTVSGIGMRCTNGSTIDGWQWVGGNSNTYSAGDDCNRYGGSNAMKGVRMYSHTYVDEVQTECVALTSP